MTKKNGFTLVELLAVIAILSLIMTVATVSVVAVLNKQQETLGKNMENDLKEAAISYVQQKGYYLKTCTSAFRPENPNSEKCYKEISVEAILKSGLFTDDKSYCKKEEKVIIYKNNEGSYSDLKTYMNDRVCRK